SVPNPLWCRRTRFEQPRHMPRCHPNGLPPHREARVPCRRILPTALVYRRRTSATESFSCPWSCFPSAYRASTVLVDAAERSTGGFETCPPDDPQQPVQMTACQLPAASRLAPATSPDSAIVSALDPPAARSGSSVTSSPSTPAAEPSAAVPATAPEPLTSFASIDSGSSVTVFSARFHSTSGLPSGLDPEVPMAKSPLMLETTLCSAPSSTGSSRYSPSEFQITGTVTPSSPSALPPTVPASSMLSARAWPCGDDSSRGSSSASRLHRSADPSDA